MRTQKSLFAVFAAVLTFLSGSALAKNNVTDIDIAATLRSDGSARIVQKWHGNFDEGTENYIPIATDGIGILDFTVSDDSGRYSFSDDWNIDAGFDDKSRKCGMVRTDTGVELCFGISNYGDNRYTIEYTVSDLVKGYTDFDGTNFMFINPGMSTFPTNAKISITMENGTVLTEENAAIWAFGFDGEIFFENGTVSAHTSSPLEGNNSMIIMMRFNKGLLSPAASVPESFDEVKSAAFEGSDYGYDEEESSILELIIGSIILFGIFAVFILIIYFIIKRKREIKKFSKSAGYFRDVPNSGKIEVSHYLAQTFDVSGNESLVMGALILSMINKRCIEPQIDENVGFFGKVKQSVNLRLINAPNTAAERSLYNILILAAGDDGILQEKELENYAYKNPETITAFLTGIKKDGESEFTADNGFVSRGSNCIHNLSEHGKSELAEVIGLKKYLEDFSLIAEREIQETIIWQDYMVYATLFGIADKVIKQMEKVYPEKVPEIEIYNRNVIIASSYCYSMHHSAQRAQQARTNGMGGSASIGGGGGFSGGGYGGGSR